MLQTARRFLPVPVFHLSGAGLEVMVHLPAAPRRGDGPPSGYRVEWQVLLDSPDGTVRAWGAYAPSYQRLLEDVWQEGSSGTLLCKPGETQEYVIDLGALTQTRVSCPEGWGGVRRVRRCFVPDLDENDELRGDEPLTAGAESSS